MPRIIYTQPKAQHAKTVLKRMGDDLNVITRTRVACCGSCSNAVMTSLIEKEKHKAGVVYTHKQSYHRNGYTNLLHSPRPLPDGEGAGEAACIEFAKRVVQWCEDEKIPCDWDGNPNNCIRVMLDKPSSDSEDEEEISFTS